MVALASAALKSLIISPILHHSHPVEDCLRKNEWKFQEEKKIMRTHIVAKKEKSFNLCFGIPPIYLMIWSPL